jgi:hypothetical protein
MIRPLRSAPVTGASPLLRAGPPACPVTVLNLSQFLLLETLPLAASRTAAGGGTGTCLPTFHAKAADQARVASMPDTAWPVSGLPPGLSRGSDVAPVSMSPDCITTRPQRFTRVRLPGPHLTPQPVPFPHRSPRSRHHSRSMWRFEASLRRATPKGQTFIFRTAPRSTAAYLHDHLPSRSWHTIGCNTAQFTGTRRGSHVRRVWGRVGSLTPAQRGTQAAGGGGFIKLARVGTALAVTSAGNWRTDLDANVVIAARVISAPAP